MMIKKESMNIGCIPTVVAIVLLGLVICGIFR